MTFRPVISPSGAAVCIARCASEDAMRPGRSAATSAAASNACARPMSSSGGSAWPWKRCCAFHSVRPCRSSSTRRRVTSRLPVTVVELDHGAVLPEPFEPVEDPLLGVLDVHHDVGVVEQHPASVAPALTPKRLDARLAQVLLHGVHDGIALALFTAGHDHEDGGDVEPFASVDEDDVGGELVRRGVGGYQSELTGGIGRGHVGELTST